MIPALKAAQGETVEKFVQDAANCPVSKLDDRLDFLKLMSIGVTQFMSLFTPAFFPGSRSLRREIPEKTACKTPN